MDLLRWGGLITTFSLDSSVTDSAASATALATGYKTNNGMVAIDPSGGVLETVLELAEDLGMSTGLVTTTRITHATPAAFAAHVVSRDLEDEIGDQMLKADTEILMGGGRRHFLPASDPGGARLDQRNLTATAQEVGYTVVSLPWELALWDRSTRLLGLFNDSHMSYDLSRIDSIEPSLSEMTSIALGALAENPRGFFAMIEGGRIDHASHANDINTTVGEVIAFDAAVGVAINFTRSYPDALLLVTADHETGGLSVIQETDSGKTQVSWRTSGHTDEPVPWFSTGLLSGLFQGVEDNADFGSRLIRILRGSRPTTMVAWPSGILGTAIGTAMVAITSTASFVGSSPLIIGSSARHRNALPTRSRV